MEFWTALVLVLAFAGTAGAQYAPDPIILDGDAAPGITTGLIDNVGRPNFNAAGSYIVEGDGDATPLDEFIIIDGSAVLFEGDPIVGAGGATLLSVNAFDTRRHIDAAGNYVWVGLLSGATTATDAILCRNDTKLVQEGDASPFAGRLFVAFNSANIDDAGNVYFEADLDLATTDDEVLMVWSGGGALPISMNVSTFFREGQLIVGGPLDGFTLETATAFEDLRVNGAGRLIVDANLDEVTGVTTADDDVILGKGPGTDYELLLRAGDLLTTPLSGSVPFENSWDISLAENGDWALRGEVTTGGTTDDYVVIAGFGVAAPAVIAQEGEDISALTGLAGTTLGNINGVSINSNGKVLFLADILPTTAPWDEGLFVYDGGVLTLLMTDEIAVPALGGANCTGITADNVFIDNSDRVFFEGDVLVGGVTLDGIFEALIPAVLPMTGLACDQLPATTTISATWTNSAVTPYDGIRVYVDGALQTTLAGTATSYTSGPLSLNAAHDLDLEPFIGPDTAGASCSVFIVAPRDYTECRVPAPPGVIADLASLVDVLTFPSTVSILDLTLSLDITHSYQGDLDIDLVSPSGTQVTLMTDLGTSGDNILATFADFGIPIGTVGTGANNLNSGLFVQPEAPGSMADFRCEGAAGDWTLTVADDATTDTGTLNEWCLNIYEETNPVANCCPAPSDLACSDLGACGGPGAAIAWTNNFGYAELQLVRDDGVNPPVTIPLAAAATSYQDLAAAAGTAYTYTIEYRCVVGGGILSGESCAITPTAGFVPPITGLVCSPDFCANETTLTWSTGGVGYTSVTLNRSGSFLADVTGLASYVDTAPTAGNSTYSLIAACGAATAATNCAVTLALQGPTGLVCAVDPLLCDGSVALTWTNNGTYTSLELLIDGVVPAVGPGPTDTSFVTAPLASGPHTLELVASCPAGTAAPASCNVTVYTPPAGQTDCILALEGRESADDFGVVDSVSALAASLIANGRSVYITAPPTAANPEFTTQLPCGVDLSQFETIWVMTGTYPDDYRISAAEGNLLASLNRNNGIGIYFEGGDHWGFSHTDTDLDNRDGVETDTGNNIQDGADTFIAMSGFNSGNGLDVTVAFPGAIPPGTVPYGQDQTGTDFTDRLSPLGTTVGVVPDPDVATAGVVWTNPAETGPPNATTIYAVNTLGAAMISSSWEFGGFSLDPLDPPASDGARATLAGLYLAALGRGGSTNPQMVRGDTNDDGGVNIADAVYLLGNLFPGPGGSNVLDCLDAADANDDGGLNIADAVALLGSLFGAPATPLPFPNAADGCGEDPGQNLGCVQFDNCP